MDALALRGEEGRGKLRKAAVRSKHPLTRRCPNGGTHMSYQKNLMYPCLNKIGRAKQTQGSEPSQYLEEEKTTVIPLVAASERGSA